jgi:hypothetical protein
MSKSVPCEQRDTAEPYLLGELSDTQRQAFEAHYFECASCGEEVKTMAAFLEGARATLTAPGPAPSAPHVAPSARFRRWPGAALGLAAAAALAVLAGYQALVEIPALRREVALRERPRALAVTVLRPASRGSSPVVKAAADQPFITVAVETPEGATAVLTVALEDDAGSPVLAPWQVESPGPGEPLQLLIPTRNLAPRRYRLVLRQAPSGNKPALDSYFFIFERTRS